jgi:hypothetical protein
MFKTKAWPQMMMFPFCEGSGTSTWTLCSPLVAVNVILDCLGSAAARAAASAAERGFPFGFGVEEGALKAGLEFDPVLIIEWRCQRIS